MTKMGRQTWTLLFALMLFVCSSNAQQLVLPGDHADPSVVKIGDTYWASATTSNWFPAFPLLKSKDLVHWTQQGYIFDQKPEWADYYFWAPEITYEKGKVYVYYAAHKKNGNLCVGVASANKPEGPYKDHGPLICQPDGSIDAFPMRDEKGKLFLIWKEDANSIKQPTPIWASEMNEERTALIGEKKELFRNELDWEHNLVEGVSMMKHGGYFYAFYAAAGCCGPGCNYVVGVARSKSLLGPWEKDTRGPALNNNPEWVCPGHGTPVQKNGKFYFLYHGYNKTSHAFTGREGLLTEFIFNKEGWVDFKNEVSALNKHKPISIKDEFNNTRLSQNWQWSVFQNANKSLKNGQLYLTALPGVSGAFVGQKTLSGDYDATTVVITKQSSAWAGIAAIGDEKNIVSAMVKDNNLQVVVVKDGKETIVSSKDISAVGKLYLRMQVRNGKDLTFAYSLDGKKFITLNVPAVNGDFLPPWDRAVRAGLVSKDDSKLKAVFERFEMVTK